MTAEHSVSRRCYHNISFLLFLMLHSANRCRSAIERQIALGCPGRGDACSHCLVWHQTGLFQLGSDGIRRWIPCDKLNERLLHRLPFCCTFAVGAVFHCTDRYFHLSVRRSACTCLFRLLDFLHGTGDLVRLRRRSTVPNPYVAGTAGRRRLPPLYQQVRVPLNWNDTGRCRMRNRGVG